MRGNRSIIKLIRRGSVKLKDQERPGTGYEVICSYIHCLSCWLSHVRRFPIRYTKP